MKAVEQLSQQALAEIQKVVSGKELQVKLAINCLLSGGHILLEDIPGLGKTTLALALAKVFGLQYNRIQFTSDLLPSDIIGSNIFDQKQNDFVFRKGPIFNQLILADELNRATPKAQSALLEAMEEGQVSMDGQRLVLPDPFFVIATQNPQTQSGTYPLPESQLDRFLMKITMGYPDLETERLLLTSKAGRVKLEQLSNVVTVKQITSISRHIVKVHLSDALLDYVQSLIQATRDPANTSLGLSPRAGIALVRSAQCWALMHGREHVLPEDVQAVFVNVAAHRLQSVTQHSSEKLAQEILAKTPLTLSP